MGRGGEVHVEVSEGECCGVGQQGVYSRIGKHLNAL